MDYSFEIVNEKDEFQTIQFVPNEYDNLMILLYDRCIEEWGDCKGRAWCGTCHIEMIRGAIPAQLEKDERVTLNGLPNLTSASRLACQIPANEQLNGMRFRILKDD